MFELDSGDSDTTPPVIGEVVLQQLNTSFAKVTFSGFVEEEVRATGDQSGDPGIRACS